MLAPVLHLLIANCVQLPSCMLASSPFHCFRSASESVAVKMELRGGLSEIRACRPLQLSLAQLAALARHFNKRVRATAWG